jgi:hypothetical protein
MKPKLLALLLCDAIVPGPDGKTNLYGIFDKIHGKNFPARHPQLGVFWRCFVPEAGEVGITIYRPDGMPLLTLDPVMVDKIPGIAQGIYMLSGVEFPSPGEYEVRLIYNGIEEIASFMLTVEETR